MKKQKFIPYQHIEKLGSPLVEGITKGSVHVFPKLDGGCTSAWLDSGVLSLGGRRHVVNIQGSPHIYKHFDTNSEKYAALFEAYPDWVLYGEFGNKTTIRYYKDEVWGNYYVFDVVVFDENDAPTYIPYEEYSVVLEHYGINYIPCIAVITDGDFSVLALDLFNKASEHFIDKELAKGKPAEGVVLKNYAYRNRHGNQIWAKLITDEYFARKNKVKSDGTVDDREIEQILLDELLTDAFIAKELQKVIGDSEWKNSYIQLVLERTWEVWLPETVLDMQGLLYKHKRFVVDFKHLKHKFRVAVTAYLKLNGYINKGE